MRGLPLPPHSRTYWSRTSPCRSKTGSGFLALTAYGGQLAHDRVLAAGFDAYLAKPVEPVEVGRVVRKLALKNSS
jgi:CheY-like chemotaxis protein